MSSIIIPLIFGLVIALGGAYLITIAETSGYIILSLFTLFIPITIAFFFSVPETFKKFKNLILSLKWFHILWALYLISGLTFRLRSAKSAIENPLDKAAIFRVCLVTFVGASLLLAFAFQKNLHLDRIFGGVLKWLYFYSFICIFSTLWSYFPLWTLYRSVEYFIGVFLVGMIVSNINDEKDFKCFLDWTIFLYGVQILSVLFGVICYPNMAINRGIGILGIQIKGVFPKIAANGVGDISALVGIVSFVRLISYDRNRSFYFIVFVVSIITLILSQSRSPLTGFLLGITLILFLSKKIKWIVFLTLIGVIVVFTSFLNIFIEFFMRGQSKELFWSLSGRIPAWKVTLSVFMGNPILGYGAYAAGRFFVGLKYGYMMSSLHSDWVETLIGTGILGFSFLLICLIAVWWTILKASNLKNPLCNQLRLEILGILMLLTFRSIFSVPLIWHSAIPWRLVIGFAQFLRINSERNQK